MTKAKKMFEIIKQAPMKDEVREKFQNFADENNHEGMKNYFDACLKYKPEIGVQVQESGHKPFESMVDEINSIYFAP